VGEIRLIFNPSIKKIAKNQSTLKDVGGLLVKPEGKISQFSTPLALRLAHKVTVTPGV
jgi:hypothetical protein